MSGRVNTTYKGLKVWQKSATLTTSLYDLVKSFPLNERFGIVSQLNRVSSSIPSNIKTNQIQEDSKILQELIKSIKQKTNTTRLSRWLIA